jgi:hypothetical protein
MNIASYKWLVSFCLILVLVTSDASAQCPDGSQITSNDHCFFATWDTPPVPLPTSIVNNNKVYSYISGQGTASSPARYQGSGGNGACNAGESGFTGIIEVDGETCSYIDGELQQPLPVTLISFDATRSGDQVIIAWKTSFEFDNREFKVERLDARSGAWIMLDIVPGRGNFDDFTTYTFIDRSPLTGTNQYRLVQVDFDGKETLSGIVSVDYRGGAAGYNLLPNPANSFVEIIGGTEGTADIYTAGGTLMATQNLSNSRKVDLNSLSSGLYIVRIEGSGEVSTHKLIVN